ncbi:hypothetical protein FRC18_007460 [Serendipita sp. 400]|nr:hypothetical protein FRC18_007460 [Serendipita sp. 400]
MFFQFLKQNVTSVQDVLWALIHTSDKSPPTSQSPTSAQPESPPPPYTPTKSPLDTLWSLIYSVKPQVSLPPPTTTQPKPPLGSASTELKPVIQTIVNKSSPLFALIIGINEYKSSTINNLGGAIADAKEFKSYLETSLSVPTTQITTLYDAEATRDAIVKSIRDFKDDSRIQNGDPILIFYAGHGGTGKHPTGSTEIQILLSYDTSCEDNKGRKICGVPDRTMGVLLDELAKAKGDNITVIFDCCHSGSLTRDAKRANLVRGVKQEIVVPNDLDKDILGSIKDISSGTRSTTSDSKFLKAGLNSHVLLAACGSQETAKEDSAGTRGIFTKALLDVLVTVGAEKLTYADLIERLPSLHEQNPQCEGHNRTRILFDSKAPSRRRPLYAVREKDGKYILEAGAAHGITKGATFDVYKNRDCIESEAPLGALTASEPPNPFSTVLSGPSGKRFNFGEQAVALQTGAGTEEDLLIHVAMDPTLENVFRAVAEEIKGSNSGQQQIKLVDADQIGTAHLDIGIENKKVVFNILNPLVTVYGLKRIPFQIDPNIGDIRRVLRAAGHFHWHLHRTGKSKILQNKVKIKLMKLKENEGNDDDDDDEDSARTPVDGENLIQEGVVDVIADVNTMYGIEITNTWDTKLYASVFYFDNSNLSIHPYCLLSSSSGTVDSNLRPGQSLTIGYGPEGGDAFRYSLPVGRDIDVGFIKFFISTEPVDLAVIPQPSPFKQEGRESVTVPPKPRLPMSAPVGGQNSATGRAVC